MSSTKTTKKYQQLSQREHAINNPGMYMGDIGNKLVDKYIYKDGHFEIDKVEYNGGCYKIIDEVFSNASDQVILERNEKNGCNIIKINIQKEPFKITVWNNSSDGVPLEKTKLTAGENKGKEVYNVEMIFGEFLTSGNYDKDKDREANGVNGLGVKLTNVYSSEFTVETITNKKKAIKKYYDSLSRQDDIIIENVNDKINSVCVSFIPNLEMFKVKNEKEHFHITDNFIHLLEKKTYDLSYCCNCIRPTKVYLNDKLIVIKDELSYISMFNIPNMIFCKLTNKFTIGLSYTPNKSNIISFINNNPVIGGTHIDYIIKKIFKLIKDKAKNKDKQSKFKKEYLTSNLTIFCNGYIKNPNYDSQCKERLINSFKEGDDLNGKIGMDFNDDFYKMFEKFYKSGIMTYMNNLIIAADNSVLKKTDGCKTNKLIKIDNYEKANLAGTKDSLKCKLIITEGLSAMTFAEKGRAIINANYFGVFPIRGKLLNVKKASPQKVMENKEITNIKQIIGLEQNKDYSKPENLNKLNYGGILILTDQDLDGYHIKCLIINFINFYWKELIKNGFCCALQTPILKAFSKRNKKDVICFYNQVDYYDWTLNNDVNDYSIHYYKGLGSSSDKEVRECFNLFQQNLITYVWNDDNIEINTCISANSSSISPFVQNVCDYAIDLAFGEMLNATKLSDARKEWLKHYDKNAKPKMIDNKVSIDELINKDLIHFSFENNMRSIPMLYDGLKPSQRKILYTLIHLHLDDEKNKERVDVLTSKVIALTAYDHGNTSLMEAIVNMAQDFPGSNNLNLLVPEGNFGTLKLGGADHGAGRYIHSYLNKIVYKIFRKEDECILKHLIEEGRVVEYETFYPIIPMVLINGADGIGTGYNTKIPNFNIKDVIFNLKCLINEPNDNGFNKMKTLTPYYNCLGQFNFIHPNLISNAKDKNNNDIPNKWISYAQYDIINDKQQNTIHINALPVGKWTNLYTNAKGGVLSDLIDDDVVIRYENNSNPVNVDIKVKVNELSKYLRHNDIFGFTDINDKFKFTSTINANNMVLHKFDDDNHNDIFQYYNSVNDIIVDFYNTRYEKYELRKEEQLKILKFDMDFLNFKIKFIDEVLKNTIIWNGKNSSFVIKQLEDKNYPKMGSNYKDTNLNYDYLLNINFKYFTDDYKNKLINNFNDKEKIYNDYNNISITDLWLREIKELEDAIDDIETNTQKKLLKLNSNSSKSINSKPKTSHLSTKKITLRKKNIKN